MDCKLDEFGTWQLSPAEALHRDEWAAGEFEAGSTSQSDRDWTVDIMDMIWYYTV